MWKIFERKLVPWSHLFLFLTLCALASWAHSRTLLWADEDGAGLPCVHSGMSEHGRGIWGGKSNAGPAVCSMPPSHCVGGTRNWGCLLFICQEAQFAFQVDLKMLLIWMGLAVVFLVCLESSWWMIALGRKRETWRVRTWQRIAGRTRGREEKLIATKKVA